MGVVMASAFSKATCVALLLLAGGAGNAAAYQGPPPPHARPAHQRSQPQAVDGPVFSAAQLQQGVEIAPQHCALYASTVYVEAQGVGICFRYYLSNAGGGAAEAVYWLSGDKSGERLAFDPATFERQAMEMSRRYRRPAVYLARMGLDGSSGWHQGWRRTLFEVEVTSRAIDAINARHGFRLIHVMGQSGGGHLIGAFLGLRRDIGCAVPGSGALSFDPAYRARQSRRPEIALRHYDPATRIREAAAQSRSTRILVVTDPDDTRVRLPFQSGFVEGVQRFGGRISQFYVVAFDELRHGVALYTREAMAGCLAGASDGEIHATLQRLVAFVQARHAAQQAGGRPPTNYREAVQPFQVAAPASARVNTPSAPPAAMPRIAGPAYVAPPAMPQVAGPAYVVPSSPPPPPPGLAGPYHR
jgi:hypothetical protein